MYQILSGEEAVGIPRKSSKGQSSSISNEAQSKAMKAYCEKHGLLLKEKNIFSFAESAKDSDNRRKYRAAIKFALSNNIRHVLFYMYDRESRNLTDNEQNEKLVLQGKLVIHYVHDNKILHKDSPDSEFFMRDMQAAANKQFSRHLSVRVVDAMKKKAEEGWYPSNNLPLGYAPQRLKDERGREARRGAIVAADPDPKRVEWVQREFALRAKGLSLEAIREQVIADGLIPLDFVKKYDCSAIHQRLRNPFYAGRFTWAGEEYDGKHPLIISPAVFQAAQKIERVVKRRSYDPDHGHLIGFLRCAECGCHLVYDPKKKVTRAGKVSWFHYYRCSNGRRMHETMAGKSVNETKLWDALGAAVDMISLTPLLATNIAKALNETQTQTAQTVNRKIAELRESINQLEAREDRAYDDMSNGTIDTESYQRALKRFRSERKGLNDQINALQAQASGSYRETALTTIELCKEAKSLYLSRSAIERADLLKKLVSNPRVNGANIEFDLKKPFGILAEIAKSENWRGREDSNHRPPDS